jgi:hypothetical protein
VSLTLEDLQAMMGSARGKRPAEPLSVEFVRELTPADGDLLLNPPPMGSTTPMVKRLRSQHHHLARLCAAGMKDVEAANVTGFSQSRVCILKHDPAFQELMAYYAGQAEAKFLDVHERLAKLGEAVVEEIHERLEDNPDDFSTKELIAIGEFTLDRSVAPPKSRMTGATGVIPAISISFHAGVPQAALPQPANAMDFIEGSCDEDDTL